MARALLFRQLGTNSVYGSLRTCKTFYALSKKISGETGWGGSGRGHSVADGRWVCESEGTKKGPRYADPLMHMYYANGFSVG